MAYRKETPLATERPSVSQPKIKENFIQINDQFGVDHTELEESTNLGKHKKVTLYEQADDPETLADEIVIYSKEGDNGTELYYREENNGNVKKVSGLTILAAASTNINGTLINDKFNVASAGVIGTALNQTIYRITFENELSDNTYLFSATQANGSNYSGSMLAVSKTTTHIDISFDSGGGGIRQSGMDMFIYRI